MNNTTKAKYDVAKRMIAGHLEVSEVAAMTELPLEEIQKLKDEFDKTQPADLDFTRLNLGPVLYDNYITPEEQEIYEEMKENAKEAEEQTEQP